jgi:Ca2+-binding EF-hand superfamily protein
MSVEEIRKLILKSNVYKSPCLFISHLFKKMDVDHSASIDYIEFKKGLRYLGVLRNFNENETKSLFARFDRSKNGNISFSDWVITLRPPLSPGRYNVINEAFQKLDTNNDGNLSIEDFEKIYAEQAKRHPKYLSKEWTMNEVRDRERQQAFVP